MHFLIKYNYHTISIFDANKLQNNNKDQTVMYVILVYNNQNE